MKVLVVSSAVPFPAVGGGKLRTFHLSRLLAEKHDVTIVAFTFDESPVAPSPFPVRMVTVSFDEPELYQRMKAGDVTAFHELRDHSEPWFASYYESEAMRHALVELLGEGFDLVLYEGSDMARYMPMVGEHSGADVIDFMDVYSRMIERTPDVLGPAEVTRARGFEAQLVNRADLVLTCSEHESDYLRNALGTTTPSTVVPNGVDTSYFRPGTAPEVESEIVFTGSMNYPPNIEAVTFFVDEILPVLLDERPQLRLRVVGSQPTREVLELAGPHVSVEGLVDDVRPYLHAAAVVVVPILSGGGTRLKVLEAAACGKAVVSTSLGAEGFDLRHGEHLLIADDAATFASAVSQLLSDAALRQVLGRNARAASLQYDWDHIRTALDAAVAACVHG